MTPLTPEEAERLKKRLLRTREHVLCSCECCRDLDYIDDILHATPTLQSENAVLQARLAEAEEKCRRLEPLERIYHAAFHAMDDSADDGSGIVTILQTDAQALGNALDAYEEAFPEYTHGEGALPPVVVKRWDPPRAEDRGHKPGCSLFEINNVGLPWGPCDCGAALASGEGS